MKQLEDDNSADNKLLVIFYYYHPSEHESYIYECITSGIVPENRERLMDTSVPTKQQTETNSLLEKAFQWIKSIIFPPEIIDSQGDVFFLYDPKIPLRVFIYIDLYFDVFDAPRWEYFDLEKEPEWVNMDLELWYLNSKFNPDPL